MCHSSHKLNACATSLMMMIALTASPLPADIIGSFDGPGVNVNGFSLVQTIDFDVVDADDIAFEANFFVIDAGIQITVNGTPLFTTGPDVTQFGTPDNFFSTPGTDSAGVPFDNIGFGFNPLTDPVTGDDLPRLTVNSDSAGTAFSGYNQVNLPDVPLIAPTAVTYTTSFPVEIFTDLLNDNSPNTIQIFNINDNSFARLDGDFTLTVEASAVPEPSSLSLLLLGSLFCMKRRRHQKVA